MHVRDRHDVDIEELIALAGRVRASDGYPVYLPGDDLRRFLTKPEPISAWVADREGVIVGHVALTAKTSPPVMELVRGIERVDSVAFIARLLVDRGARRCGAGGRLLDRARREAVAANLVPMLDVVDQSDGITCHRALTGLRMARGRAHELRRRRG